MEQAKFGIKRAVGYGTVVFITIVVVGLLLGEFFVPIKQLMSGDSPDFAGQLEKIDFTRRISIAFVASVVLTLLKHKKEKAKQNNNSTYV
ncbi:hypothetical protein [Cesiribacter sp. SM1]|uniref:hypothetical protein n=1 Tax=Cesiribacter sp. SM1 TaxID=2861196 RepID=UPI001CD21DE6|nr:hypothetical protein [Cesiribacter sp. SM1]